MHVTYHVKKPRFNNNATMMHDVCTM
jgi:hypothetical protein